MVIFHTDHWGALAHFIVLATQEHKSEECVLIFTESDTDKIEIIKRLVNIKIFSKTIVDRELLCPGSDLHNKNLIINEIQKKYDEVLGSNGVNIKEASAIYTVTDIHGIFRFYLIQKNIKFIHITIGDEKDLYARYRSTEAFKIGAITKEYMELLNENNVYYANNALCEKLIVPEDILLKENFHSTDLKIVRENLSERLENIDREIAINILKCFDCELGDLEKIKNIVLSNSDGFIAPRIAAAGCYRYDRLQHTLLYQELVDFYMQDELKNLLIKPHPHNYIDWNKYFENAVVLNRSMPIELVNFSKNIRINKVVALETTAIKKIENKVNEIVLATESYANYVHVILKLYISCYFYLKTTDHMILQVMGFKKDFFYNFLKHVMKNNINNWSIQETSNWEGKFFRIYNKLALCDVSNMSTVLTKMDNESIVVILNIPSVIPICNWNKNLFSDLVIFQIRKQAIKENVIISLDLEYIFIFAKSREKKEQLKNMKVEKYLKACGVQIYAEALTEFETQMLIKNYKLQNELLADRSYLKCIVSQLRKDQLKMKYSLCHINNLEEYLIALTLVENTIFFVAVKDNAGKAYTYNIVKCIENLGLSVAWNNIGWRGYITIKDEKNVIVEKLGTYDKPLDYKETFQLLNIELHSKPYKQGNSAEIIINGIDYAVNGRGINIVVYDKAIKRVVDSVCFDTFVEACTCTRKK